LSRDAAEQDGRRWSTNLSGTDFDRADGTGAIAAGRWTAFSNAHKLCQVVEVCKFDAARSFPGRRRTIHAGSVSARTRKQAGEHET